MLLSLQNLLHIGFLQDFSFKIPNCIKLIKFQFLNQYQMGACKSNLASKLYAKQNLDHKSAPQTVLKCPNGHWMAVFNSKICSHCSISDNNENPVIFSCTKCAYSLCDMCYINKLKKWSKSAAKDDRQLLHRSLTNINTQLDQVLRNQDQTKKQRQFKRIHSHLSLEYQKSSRDLKEFDKYFSEQLQQRIKKMKSKCEAFYNIPEAQSKKEIR